MGELQQVLAALNAHPYNIDLTAVSLRYGKQRQSEVVCHLPMT